MTATSGPADNPPTESGYHGILISDLRGFTAITEQYAPLIILPLLNFYFEQMTRLIHQHGGHVHKFMGDSILALFPFSHNDAAGHMLSCAIDMQLAMDEVNRFAAEQGLPDLYMGIGISCGNILACELGSDGYREQTIFGDPVNVASRMANFTLRGQVLVTDSVVSLCRNQVELGADFNLLLKGKKKILKIHELQGLRSPVAKSIPLRENRRSPRVEAFLPVSYFLIDKKRVSDVPQHADIRDLSYGGMSLLTKHELGLLDELKLVIPFALGEQSQSEAYAKVLSCQAEGEGAWLVSVEFTYLDETARQSIKTLVDRLL